MSLTGRPWLPGAQGSQMLWAERDGKPERQTDPASTLVPPLINFAVVLTSWCLSFPSGKVGLTLTAVPTSRGFVTI